MQEAPEDPTHVGLANGLVVCRDDLMPLPSSLKFVSTYTHIIKPPQVKHQQHPRAPTRMLAERTSRYVSKNMSCFLYHLSCTLNAALLSPFRDPFRTTVPIQSQKKDLLQESRQGQSWQRNHCRAQQRPGVEEGAGRARNVGHLLQKSLDGREGKGSRWGLRRLPIIWR